MPTQTHTPSYSPTVSKDVLHELFFTQSLDGFFIMMLDEAVDCEVQFADDILSGGVPGLSAANMRQYLEFIADQRLAMLDTVLDRTDEALTHD